MPQPGAGQIRRRHCFKLEQYLEKKNSLIKIQNQDELCCGRAIVTAKALADNSPYYDSIRKGNDRQRQLAEQLHLKANVLPGPCGLQEVKKFQDVLEGYQLVVVSKEHLNGIIFQGPEEPLLMAGFLARAR